MIKLINAQNAQIDKTQNALNLTPHKLKIMIRFIEGERELKQDLLSCESPRHVIKLNNQKKNIKTGSERGEWE